MDTTFKKGDKVEVLDLSELVRLNPKRTQESLTSVYIKHCGMVYTVCNVVAATTTYGYCIVSDSNDVEYAFDISLLKHHNPLDEVI